MGRPREHGAATRARLLEAARRILAESGPAALNLRGLATEVGTSTRAVYALFESKEGLLRALYVDGFDEFAERLAKAGARPGPPRVVLLALGAAYRDFARADPARYRLMCEQLIPEFDPTPMDRRHALDALEHLSAAVGDCVAAGEWGSTEVGAATLQWWAMLHGLAALEIRGVLGRPDTARRHWERALAAFYDGLAAQR